MSVKKGKGHATALITILVWGSTFIALKYLLGKFQPLELLITRFTISFLLLWMLEPKWMKSTWKDERLFFLAGLSGIAGYYTLEALALEISQSSNVGVLVSISPLMTALLARLILKERLPKGFFVGCIISFIGLALMTYNGKMNLKINPKGDLLAVGAALSWAVYSITTPKIFSKGYSLISATRRIFMYGVLCMLPFIGIMKFQPDFSVLKDWRVTLCLFYLAGISSCGGFISWNFAVKTLGPVTTNLYIYLIPMIAVFLGAAILHEKVTLLAIFSSLLILLGLLITQWDTLKNARKRKKKGKFEDGAIL